MNAVNSISSNSFTMAGTGAAKKSDSSAEKTDDGVIRALKPKFAHSREELIQNKIDDLREQLSALADADEIDEKTKENMRKGINEQISELNVELMDLRKQRMEKEAEKAAGNSDRSRKFDRYEPSGAMKNMNKAASADVALEQAKIQKRASGKLENRQKIVKSELDADISNGAAAKQKEEELVELKTRLRDSMHNFGDKLKEDDDEKDEPTFMTFNTGLLWIEELKQRAAGRQNAAISAMEKFISSKDNDGQPFGISGNVISGVPVKTLEEADKWGI